MRFVVLSLLIGCSSTAETPTVKPTPPAAKPDPAWRERIVKVFGVLTKGSMHPGKPDAVGSAGWRALGEPPPAALDNYDALADRVASRVAAGTLAPTKAWQVVAAMANATDEPHTMLGTPDALAQFGGSVQGQPFTAPGIVVHSSERALVVSDVFAGGPAHEAGLAIGDTITAINGNLPARSWSLRGMTFVPVGTEVTLSIVRDGAKRELAYRARAYEHPVASHRVVGTIGIIKPYFFSKAKDPARNTIQLARVALAEFDRAKVTGIVIDLRGNQGGSDPQGYASLFTDADPVLIAWRRWEDRAKPDVEKPFPWKNSKNLWPTKRPIAVLIDEQSVSAAEMVALALREHAKAHVFGQISGVALNVPDALDLGDGHMLLYPNVPVYAPSGIEQPPLLRIVPDEGIANRSVADLKAGRDQQLDAAVKWLATKK